MVFERHHLGDGQMVLEGKSKVALIVCGHAHDRAVAVTHEHIVAHPHRHLIACDRVHDMQACGHAHLVFHRQLGLGGAAFFALFQERCQLGVGGCSIQRQGVFGSHRAKSHAHDGVSAGGEHIHAAVLDQFPVSALDIVGECKAHTLRLADPILLHQAHFVGPAVQGGFGVAHLHMIEQLLRIVGDLQVVARDFTLFHHRTGAPAFAVDDLLVGQHGLVHRVPVHHLGLAVGHAHIEHLQKEPLVPFVIGCIAGGDFTAPVDGQPHGLHLLFHVRDVLVGPLGGWHAVL